MQMFDEETATLIETYGTVEQRRWLVQDALQAKAMDEACQTFLTAERKFRTLNRNPDSVTNPRLNGEWWDALEDVYQAERRVRQLFIGPQVDVHSNRLYARFRGLLLKGNSLKADA